MCSAICNQYTCVCSAVCNLSVSGGGGEDIPSSRYEVGISVEWWHCEGYCLMGEIFVGLNNAHEGIQGSFLVPLCAKS